MEGVGFALSEFRNFHGSYLALKESNV
jgi:hypothetical protein